MIDSETPPLQPLALPFGTFVAQGGEDGFPWLRTPKWRTLRSVCLKVLPTYFPRRTCCQCAVAPVAPYACCVGCLLPSVVPFNFVDRSGLLRRPPGDSPSPWVGHVVNVRFSCLPAFFVGHTCCQCAVLPSPRMLVALVASFHLLLCLSIV